MKKCFTINPMRTEEEFVSYWKLFEDNIYQAIEIFYPYNQPLKQIIQYTNSVYKILEKYPHVEVVLHLPHGVYNGLCMDEHLNAGSLEIMMAGVKFASQFKTKKLTLHLGHVDINQDRNKYITKIIPTLQKLCDYAQKFNQTVMIENMPSYNELGYSPNEILTIIQNVNKENLKFIFDTGHAHVSEYDDVSYLKILKEYLYHIHYNDNDSTKDAHKRIGCGNIDFKKHFKTLKEINYNQLHCMEVIFNSVEELIDYANDLRPFEEE